MIIWEGMRGYLWILWKEHALSVFKEPYCRQLKSAKTWFMALDSSEE
jgi:hypothetical protein